MLSSDIFSLKKIKQDVEEIAAKHKIDKYDMLAYCINKYTDNKTHRSFYHNTVCTCGLITCSDCSNCMTAQGHILMEEIRNEETGKGSIWKRHTKRNCKICLFLEKIYFAQCEMIASIPEILGTFPKGTVEKEDSLYLDVIIYKCHVQQDLSFIFEGLPRVNISGAKLVEETAIDVMRLYDGFKRLES